MFTMRFNPYDPDQNQIAIGTEQGMVYIYNVPTQHYYPENGIDTCLLSSGKNGSRTPCTSVR
jgi:hypothetical protein